MKWLLLLSLVMSSSAFAISHKEFVKLPRDKREKIVEAYKSFLKEYSKTVKVAEHSPLTFPQLIEAAYASDYDCLYGGWPSKLVGGVCSPPNMNQQKESCGQGQMQCQPLLFAQGLCAPNVTSEQKKNVFANCQNNFEKLDRNNSDVVEYSSDPEVSQDADELFRLIDEVCASPTQASTAKCRSLKARLEENQRSQSAQRSQDSIRVAAQDSARIESIVHNLNTQVRCESCKAQRRQTTDDPLAPAAQEVADDEPTPIPYPRATSGYTLASCSGGRPHPDGYQIRTVGNCRDDISSWVDSGFRFDPGQGHPYTNVQTRYPNGGPPGRFFQMNSINQAFNETYLLMEEYGGGPDSHNVKSYMFVIPRTTVPSVRTEGNNLILTLPTGETVTMDKRTKAIISGALTEGPIDLNTDRFQRKPPNIHYSGAGISIRLDHRYEHPMTSAQTATVKQGGRTCTIQRTSILDSEGKLLTSSDADLIAVLNRSCRTPGAPFRIP